MIFLKNTLKMPTYFFQVKMGGGGWKRPLWPFHLENNFIFYSFPNLLTKLIKRSLLKILNML